MDRPCLQQSQNQIPATEQGAALGLVLVLLVLVLVLVLVHSSSVVRLSRAGVSVVPREKESAWL
jgi:Tfp pilus assembly protein PilX